jgi:hypothetical protein
LLDNWYDLWYSLDDSCGNYALYLPEYSKITSGMEPGDGQAGGEYVNIYPKTPNSRAGPTPQEDTPNNNHELFRRLS